MTVSYNQIWGDADDQIFIVKKFLIILPGIFEKYTQGKLEWGARVFLILKNLKKTGPKFIGEYKCFTLSFLNSNGKKNCIHKILKNILEKIDDFFI